jgi:pimeloyl-ACP methyl ester carboxylesterase
MKNLFLIAFYFLGTFLANAQDSCLPKYNLAVKTIQLSSGKLAYAEKGTGQTILFIHGLGGNISHWTKTITDLSADYKCIAVDLPGYGWSDKQVDTKGKDRLQFYADALGEFLKKKKIKKVILAGHSMGGQIATIMALQNKRIKKLLLIAPAGLETFSEKEGQLLIAATPATTLEKQDEAVIRNNFKINFFQQPADVEQLIQDRLHMKACADYKVYCETVSAGVKGMLAHPVKDSLQYLSMPVLIVFGANDGLIPNRYLHPAMKTDELAKQCAALIRNCKVEMIEKAGHFVQFEKANDINQVIKNFLQ